MYSKKILPALLCLCFSISAGYSQMTKVETPGPNGVKFKSVLAGQDYILYIHCPGDFMKSNKKYPVLYVLDGQWKFSLTKDIYYEQFGDGLVPDIIIVGITWTGDYDASRARDFTPTQTNVFPTSGNAPKFLSVIKNEIIPYIDSAYPADKTNRALSGGSLGGLFALYALFQEPLLFNKYIVMGPSIWYDNELTFKNEKEFAKKNKTLNAKLFLSSGEYEQEADASKSFARFNSQLKASQYKGLEIETLVIDKMGHVGEGAYATGRGLQFIYSKPELILDPVLLDTYAGRYLLYSDTVLINRTGNSLYALFGGSKIRLYAESNEKFYVKGQAGTVVFKKDTNGKVLGYDLIQTNNTMVFKKIE